jgi:alkylhydroperoxidase family enzyme
VSEERPRIVPGTRAQIGLVNAAIARVLGLATGGPPQRIFTTLARNRGLFRRWLWFAGGLMPGGKLPRADTELVILRVAHLAGSEYEWAQHERIGARAGLSAAEIERARRARGAPGGASGSDSSWPQSTSPMPTGGSGTTPGPGSQPCWTSRS